MTTTQKEQAIQATAAELRMSESEVRTVVSSFDANRAALGRAQAGAAVSPKHLGGGWYLLPNGTKVQGKAAAVEAIAALSNE